MENRFHLYIQQKMYEMNGERVNEYHLMSETGIYLGFLRLPPNQQFMFDSKMLDIICKALAIRWGFIKNRNSR